MSDLWRETYARLSVHPDFLEVRSIEGPVRQRIEFLTKQLKDPRVVDPVEIATIKNELHGIEFVFETVCARTPEPDVREPRGVRVRRTVQAWKDSLFLPRPLG